MSAPRLVRFDDSYRVRVDHYGRDERGELVVTGSSVLVIPRGGRRRR